MSKKKLMASSARPDLGMYRNYSAISASVILEWVERFPVERGSSDRRSTTSEPDAFLLRNLS